MLSPQLKFLLNQRLDQEMSWHFLRNSHFGGLDFWQGVLDIHPDLRELSEEEDEEHQKSRLNDYIEEYYQKNYDKMQPRLDEVAGWYKDKSEDFFNLVDIIFKNYKWPSSQYTACGSIFTFGPRFIKDNSFQFCMLYNKEFILSTNISGKLKSKTS